MKQPGTISGRVLRGIGYGRTLGFPTANLDRREYSRKKMRVRLGVYAGRAEVGGMGYGYGAGIVIGPLDRRGLPKIEAHLIGFEGSLYGKRVTLRLLKYLRPYKIFRDERILKKQIATDLRRISQLTKTIKSTP